MADNEIVTTIETLDFTINGKAADVTLALATFGVVSLVCGITYIGIKIYDAVEIRNSRRYYAARNK